MASAHGDSTQNNTAEFPVKVMNHLEINALPINTGLTSKEMTPTKISLFKDSESGNSSLLNYNFLMLSKDRP
jgi:hypothetical protein